MTDLWQGALIEGAIWHARTGDTENAFRYGATYVALPLAAFEAGQLALQPDRFGIWTLRRADHGLQDGSSLSDFIAGHLEPLGLGHCDVTLVTLPRSLGYSFNPVSFWLARDEGGLRAVLAEVSNTFGERHLYMVRHPDNRPIERQDRIIGEKIFHVSPFLPREGHYEFRFDAGPGRFGAWIDWVGTDGRRLGTSLTGSARPMDAKSLRSAVWHRPAQVQRVMTLILWQALRLLLRGTSIYSKPPQLPVTRSEAKE